MSKNKENFLKLVSKEPTDTLEKVKWRIKNRWWIKPYQKLQIFYYILKDKLWN